MVQAELAEKEAAEEAALHEWLDQVQPHDMGSAGGATKSKKKGEKKS